MILLKLLLSPCVSCTDTNTAGIKQKLIVIEYWQPHRSLVFETVSLLPQGASTLFGPHTLSAYIQEFKKLASALISGQAIKSGPQPPDLLSKQISLLTPVVMDLTPSGVNFGDVKSDVPKNSTFKRGDTVTVVFWSACPRNDLMTEGTFSLVEILPGKGTWVPAYDDDDFCLRFKWSRPSKLSTRSFATIEWRIPESASSGVYRIKHFGAAKGFMGSIHHFTGSSSAFVVA